MVARQSCVVNQLSSTYAELRANYRFLSNDRVSVSELIGMNDTKHRQIVAGKHVLSIGDSTEISLKGQLAHLRDRDRVGVLSDNKTPGFLAHVNLLLDAQSGHGLGIGDMFFWHRAQSSGKKTKKPYTERESFKWEQGINHVEKIGSAAQAITYVCDREADIFDLFVGLKNLSSERHLVVRVRYDRSSEDDQERLSLYEYLDTIPFSDSYTLKIRSSKRRNTSRRKQENRTGREATMELRYTPVTLKPPGNFPASTMPISLWAVEARETESSTPEGEKPVHWRILTTHPIKTNEDARQIIRWYEMRWMIEQLFRLMKRKGFQIEDCELQYLDAIVKMTAMSFHAACTVHQLMLARDKPKAQPIEEVFTPKEQVCLEALNTKLQGNTHKQQNHHPKNQLSWAAWVIARLGGWKGLVSQGPPGPITMKKGLVKFHIYYDAWTIFSEK
jgi:hypothetical protein